MKSSNTNTQNGRTEQSRSRTASRPFFASIFRLPRMPSVFNIIRFCVYIAVVIWTVICLGIAAHFQSVLVSSDLTRFVPFAIFVSSASLLIVLALLGFSFWRERNPISTRVELACLGLLGVLWLALGAFVASSDAESADVECFSSDADNEPVDVAGFNTETYHAQYRVLEAFSFFNTILIWGFLIMLLVLAVRHHRLGYTQVWVSSVTAYPWFATKSKGQQKQKALPAPVTARRSRSRSRAPRVTTAAATPPVTPPAVPEKRPSQHRRPTMPRHEPTRNEVPTYVYWMPHKQPDEVHVREQHTRDKYHRNASPRR